MALTAEQYVEKEKMAQQWLESNPNLEGTDDYTKVQKAFDELKLYNNQPSEITPSPPPAQTNTEEDNTQPPPAQNEDTKVAQDEAFYKNKEEMAQQWLDKNPTLEGTDDYIKVEKALEELKEYNYRPLIGERFSKESNKLNPQSQFIAGEDFGRGIEQYTRNWPELWNATKMLTGQIFNNDELIKEGYEGFKDAQLSQVPHQKETDSFISAWETRGFGGAVDFLQYMTGQGVGMLGEAVIMAGIGAYVGAGATVTFGGVGAVPGAVTAVIAKKMVKKQLLDQVEQIAKDKGLDAADDFVKKEVAKFIVSKEGAKLIGKKVGSTVGVGLVSARMGFGETTGRAVDEAIGKEEDPIKQLEIIKSLETEKLIGVGIAHTLANYVGIRIGLGAFKTLSKPTQSMLKNIFYKVGTVGSGEAIVEALQSGLERFGAGLPLTDREAIKEYIDAAAGGFAMVSGPAVAGGAATTTDVAPEVPDVDTDTPDVDNNNKPNLSESDKKFNELKKEGKKQQATDSAQVDADESAANPVALTDTKLASFGINKNTKSYNALKNLDMTNPDNHVVFEQIIEEHDARQVKNKTGKTLNEKELDNYRSVYGNQTAGASNAVPNVPPPAGAEGSAATDGSGAAGSQGNPGRPARRTKKQPGALERQLNQAELDRLDAEVVAAQERKAERDALDVRKTELNKDDPKPLAEGQLPTTPPRPGTSGERTVLEARDDFIKADKFVTNKNVDGATISQIASRLRGPKVKGRKRREVSIAAATRIFNELEATGRYTVTTSSKGVKKLISKEAKAKPTRAEKLSALGNVTETEVIETETAEAEAAADANVDVDSEVIEADDYSNMSESDFVEGALDVDDNVDDFTTDEYKESRTGVLDTSITQETPVSVIRELVSEFGDAVNKAIDMGKLVIVDNASELPSNISISNTANGAYDGNTGTAFIIANRVKKGESRRVLLHEIGEHHGLEGLLGKDYTRTLNRLKSLKNTDKVVANVWAQVTAQYKNLTVGDVPFLQEVMAKLGETAPTNKFFNRVRSLVKNFLRKLGLINVDTLTTADLQDLVMYSLNVSMTKEDGSRTGEFMDSSLNPQFKERRDKETTFRKENIAILKKQLADVRERLFVARQSEQKQRDEDGRPSKYYSDPVVNLEVEEAELVERMVESDKLPPEQDNIQFSIAETDNLKNTGQPKQARSEALAELKRFNEKPYVSSADKSETTLFSFDTAFNNAILRTMKTMGITKEEIEANGLAMSVAQAVHAGDLVAKFMKFGTMVYGRQNNPEGSAVPFYGYENRWTALPSKNGVTFETVITALKDLAKKASTKKIVGTKKSLNELILRATLAFTAQREAALEPNQIDIDAQVVALIAKGKESEAKTLYNKQHVTLRMTESERNAALKYITPGNKHYIPGLDKVFEMWTDVRNNVIDVLVAGGKLSKEQADAYWAQLEYMPLYTRGQVESGNDPQGFFSGLLTTKTPKLKGSEKLVNNAFDNMQRWVEHSISSAIVNKAALEKIRINDLIYKDNPDAGLVRRVRKGSKNSNTFTVYVDGKAVKYEASNPYYMKAFSGFENVYASSINPIVVTLRRTAHVTRLGVVLYPMFALSQITQDAFGAYFSSGIKNPFMLTMEILKEVPLTILGASATNKMLSRNGIVGGIGTHMFGGELSNGDLIATFGKVGGNIVRPFNALATATDNAIRTAVYKQSIREKASPEKALERAAEIINFRRAGSNATVTMLRQTVPFFGAFMQALSVAGRTILTNVPGYYGINRSLAPETQSAARTAFWTNYGMAAAGTVIYTILMADEEEYKNMNPAVRDRRWVIGNTGYHINLRHDPFVFMAKTVPEYLVRKFILESVDNREFVEGLKRNFKKQFQMIPAPHGVVSLLSGYLNIDFITGRPIVPQSAEVKVKERQYVDRTSEFAKYLGTEGFGSPMMFDKFINQIFGYMGGFALFMTNALFADKANRELPKGERFVQDMFTDEWWNNLTGVSNFKHRTGMGTAELKGLYYDMDRQLQETAKNFNDLDKNEPNKRKVQEFLNEKATDGGPGLTNRNRIQIAKEIAQLKADVNTYRKRVTRIRNAPKGYWTAERKKVELKRLDMLLRTTLQTVKYYRSMTFGGGKKAYGPDMPDYDLPTKEDIKDYLIPDK